MKIIYFFFLVLLGSQMFSVTKTFTVPGNFNILIKQYGVNLPTTQGNLVYDTLNFSAVTTARYCWTDREGTSILPLVNFTYNRLNIYALTYTVSTAVVLIINYDAN